MPIAKNTGKETPRCKSQNNSLSERVQAIAEKQAIGSDFKDKIESPMKSEADLIFCCVE